MSVKEEPSTENNEYSLTINPSDIIIKEEPIMENISSNILLNSLTSELIIKDEPMYDTETNFTTISIGEVKNITNEQTIVNIGSKVVTNEETSMNSLASSIKEEPPPKYIRSNLTINSLTEMIINEQLINKNTKSKLTIQVQDVKDEQYEMPSPERCLSSEDDEPISLLMKRECGEDQKTDDEDENEPEETQSTNDDVSTPRKKKKRKRKGTQEGSRKSLTEELLEDYIVIQLSLEEQIEELHKKKESPIYLNSLFKCELCYTGFINSAPWELHLLKHAPSGGPLECPICKIRFKVMKFFNTHLVRHETKFVCKYCSQVYYDPSRAKHHLGQHKGHKYTCKYCGEAFTVRISYITHVRTKHPPEFICAICHSTYISKKGLERHRALTHREVTERSEEIREDSIDGEECDVSSVSAARQDAMASTTNTSNARPTCGETLNSEEEIKMHHCPEQRLKKPPVPNLKWPAKCEYCSEELQNSREHWFHYRSMHPDKKLVLKNHVCDVCDKSFQRNSGLREHKRIHTGERPYRCARCKKSFVRHYNLRMHEKLHSDESPFACHLCRETFKFKYALKRHLTNHSGEKLYQCDICSKKLLTARNHRNHLKNVHRLSDSDVKKYTN